MLTLVVDFQIFILLFQQLRSTGYIKNRNGNALYKFLHFDELTGPFFDFLTFKKHFLARIICVYI